ncbi:hypothetical protein CYMTET_5570 [Cymbomonas tetramitiformis]|uniref:Sulfotransferase n=1 Tax=Cymbomonas tetramitiformis TaxID=36881 RepID=A0AAE0GYW9_9CHLO|nr:hypothetical protein CYMTET_5570 [Cymbomonas tetramitiformis]|eukprot:gene4802-5870_t
MDEWKVEVIASNGEHTLKVTSKADEKTCFSIKVCFVNGVALPVWLSQSRYDHLKKIVNMRESDVIVSTYPKCGTTWTEQIVLLLLVGGDIDKLDPIHKNAYRPGANQLVGKVWPEACLEQEVDENNRKGGEFVPLSLDEFNAMPSPRLIKTHASVENLIGGNGSSGEPFLGNAKVIYVTRNPKDACVSSYHHSFNPYKSGWPFHAWAAAFLSGNIPFGSWFETTKSWLQAQAKYPEQILILHFEEMKKDPATAIRKIAVHLGMQPDEELISKVVQHSAFDSMKSEAAKKAGNSLNTVDHLRKGDVGDWRNYFSSEGSEEFDRTFQKNMEGVGMTWDTGLGDELTA